MNPEFSISQVVSNSWKRMVKVLFRPFDFYKWLVLAFCAWLVQAGSGGGGNGGSFKLPGGFGRSGSSNTAASLGEGFSDFVQQLQGSLGVTVLIIIVIALFAVLLALAFVFLWLKSRFEFIFLDNLVWNRTEIKNPWKKYKTLGNSLFSAYLFIVFLCIFLAGIIAFTFIGISSASAGAAGDRIFMWMPLFLLLAMLMALVVGVIMFFIRSMVIPVMYHRELPFSEALKIAYGILGRNAGRFVVLMLITLGLYIAFAIAVLAGVVATCCILAIILIIPVIGIMPILPAVVFFRYLGPEFLAAVEPDMNIFAPADAPPAETENAGV